jgi:NAD(P)-dependent dehydrogenase (short-subunit alcohol dehydrogenase family)
MSIMKTVVITGANSGIGRATAELLAAKNYHVITLCRQAAEGEKTVAALRKINPSAQAENFVVDLSQLSEVKRVAQLIQQKYPVIDRLINNAGYYPSSIEYVDGIEKSFVASHLGHMLLTEVLMPSLLASTEARIINVSSGLHPNGRFQRFFKQVPTLTAGQAYGDDKLANILFTMALTKKLPSNVTTYSLHPGVVNTNFVSNLRGAFKVMATLFSPFFLSAKDGAATSVYLADASIQELRGSNGKYFVKKRPVPTRNPDVTDANAQALWSRSRELLSAYK